MAMKLRVPPTQGPSRGLPLTSGSLSILALRIFSSPFWLNASPARSGTTPERSRMRPSASRMPGFSRPGWPKRTSFMNWSPENNVDERRRGSCVGARRAARDGAMLLESRKRPLLIDCRQAVAIAQRRRKFRRFLPQSRAFRASEVCRNHEQWQDAAHVICRLRRWARWREGAMAVHSKLEAALLAGSALAGMALTSVTAQAGGFAVREQSAYFQGTSFAGAAAGGPSISSMFWNPATMTGAAPGLTAESVFTGIIGDSVITPTAAAHPAAAGLLGFGDSGNISEKALVPASYIVWRPSEQWALGIATGAPFGLVTNPRALWAGMFYSRESEVITYNATPMAAYKVNNWLSVGAGLQVQYMRVRLDQAFPGSGTFPPFGPLAPDTLSINANGISVGFTAGVTLTPTPWTTIGIGYRSGINQYLEGNALRPAFVASVVPFPVIV